MDITERTEKWWLIAGLLISIPVHAITMFVFSAPTISGVEASLTGFPLDDAWIHMVYGRNLFLTGLPAYNDTIEPGFTSPLWILLVALAHGFSSIFTSDPPVVALKIIGTVVAWGTGAALAGLLFCIHRQVRRMPPFVFLLAPLWIALDPHLCFAKISGMEPVLFSGLLLGCAWALCSRRFSTAGILFALSYWTRPEAMALLPLLAVPLVIHGIKEKSIHRVMALSFRLFTPFILFFAAWSILCLSTSGNLLPNTAYNKVATDIFAVGDSAGVLKHVLMPWSTILFGLGLPLILIGAFELLFGMAQRKYDANAGLVFILIAPFWLYVAVDASRYVHDPNAFYWQRYFLPVLPLLLPALFFGAHTLAKRFPNLNHAMWSIPAIMLLLSLAQLDTQRMHYANNCRDIHILNVSMGKALKKLTHPDAVIATHDAGGIKYFSDRKIIDIVGLNDHRFLSSFAPLKSEPVSYLILARGVLDDWKDNLPHISRAVVEKNSLFATSPYWLDLFEFGPEQKRILLK